MSDVGPQAEPVEAGGSVFSGGVAVGEHETPARLAFRRFLRHRLAVTGAVALTLIILASLFAPLVADHDPFTVDLRALRQAPGGDYRLGTDLIGRDVWSRVVYGGRTSLSVGILAVSLYALIGSFLGALAGYYGGLLDQIIMRFTDTLMSIPSLLMIILFVSVVGPSLTSVIVVIGLLGWPGACRLMRGQILSLREEEFITAARAVGAGPARIIIKHMLPNTLGPLTVLATFGVAQAILFEAALSFLGLGVQPPTPSWGGMLHEAQSSTVLSTMPWLWMTPGFAIAITVLAVNFIGDGLRDAIDLRAADL